MTAAILRIKEAAVLPSIVGEYVKLRKAGPRLVGLCPFHDERTPSFGVHPTYWKCFGCGAGGDVIDFISRIESLSKGQSIRMLADRFGIPLDSTKPVSRVQRAYDSQEMAFAEWWWENQCSRLARSVSVYVRLLDRLTTEEECEAAGLLWRQVSALPRSQWRALAERCATQEDRVEWAIENKNADIFLKTIYQIIEQAHINGMKDGEYLDDYHNRVACGSDCRFHVLLCVPYVQDKPFSSIDKKPEGIISLPSNIASSEARNATA